MQRTDTKRLTWLSLLIALLIIQTFVPGIGYIPIGPMQATIIHITVIIGAILFGPKDGAILGLSWGILRLIKAFIMPDVMSPVFMNPMISVLPRFLVGWLSGLIYVACKRKINPPLSQVMTGVIGSLINTVVVLGLIYVFEAESYAEILNIPTAALLATLGGVVATNGILEAIVSGVLTPIITTPLTKIIQKNKR